MLFPTFHCGSMAAILLLQKFPIQHIWQILWDFGVLRTSQPASLGDPNELKWPTICGLVDMGPRIKPVPVFFKHISQEKGILFLLERKRAASDALKLAKLGSRSGAREMAGDPPACPGAPAPGAPCSWPTSPSSCQPTSPPGSWRRPPTSAASSAGGFAPPRAASAIPLPVAWPGPCVLCRLFFVLKDNSSPGSFDIQAHNSVAIVNDVKLHLELCF